MGLVACLSGSTESRSRGLQRLTPMRDHHDQRSRLATHAVTVAVESVRVRADDPEPAERDVTAVEIWRRRRDAHVGVGGVALAGRGGRGGWPGFRRGRGSRGRRRARSCSGWRGGRLGRQLRRCRCCHPGRSSVGSSFPLQLTRARDATKARTSRVEALTRRESRRWLLLHTRGRCRASRSARRR